MSTSAVRGWLTPALALLALSVLAACGTGDGSSGGPDTTGAPAAPTIMSLGSGFDLVPAATTFSAAFAVTPPSDGSSVTCVVTLDGALLLDVPAPCVAGEVELGPFAVDQGATLRLVASSAAGAEASATWSFTASAWAPYQRLVGTGAVLALAGSGARLAVLRDADADAGGLQVFERPFAAREAGVWAPGPVALEASLPRGRGAAIAWNRDELGWLGAAVGGVAPLDRFAPDGTDWQRSQSVLGIDWAVPFSEPRLAISDVAIVVGDAGAGDSGRWWARYAGVDTTVDERSDFGGGFPPATPGDRAGAAVAALDDAFLVGAPGAIRYPDDVSGAVRPNGRVLVAAPGSGSIEPMSGGFGSGPSAEIGQHLAVAWTPTPVAFMVGARAAAWGRVEYVPPEPDDDGGDYDVFAILGGIELSDPDATAPWGATWLAVSVPPLDPRSGGGVLASALLAIGRDDGSVHVFFVPLSAGAEPVVLGSFGAAAATGAGAWVGGALALPFGDEVVLYDLSVPPSGGPGGL